MFDLSGKKALITGGTQGIGFGIAKCLSEFGAKVFLNGSNQQKAELLLDMKIETINDCKEAVGKFLNIGINNVVVTMGENGSVYNLGTAIKHQTSFPVNVVDTTAAGDSFIGAICAGVSNEHTSDYVIKFATAVSAVTVSRKGASSSLPYAEEIIIENYN